jgi:ABC-2 type transport system ATP-binding protein
VRDNSVVRVEQVCKSFGSVQAAQDVHFAVPSGCVYGILGPNGAGKTTVIRMLMDIIAPDAGRIEVLGSTALPRVKDRVGYLPEERGLYRKMRCLDQLSYLAELKGVPRKTARERAARWLERMDLASWQRRKVDELSKGMQQKIQFAATFIFEPTLVILDEPFSGLDPLNIELLREIILEEQRKGTTVIFSTHMLAEAEKLCSAICLIDGGEVILDGTLEAVRQQFPLHAVRAAYADGRKPPADLPRVTDRKFEEGEWRLTLSAGSDPQLLLDLLCAHGPLSLFSANRPTLNDIFLAAVRHQRSGEGAPAAVGTGAAPREGTA